MIVRPRAIAIALVLLVALDLVLRLPLALPVPRYFRLPSRTLMGYDQFVDSMAREKGVRIAVVGDSVAEGGFAEPDGTLSAWLDRSYAVRDRDVHAYNLGLVGAHANDLLPLVDDLTARHATDLILVNFDYRFYRGTSVVRRYPQLYDRVTDWTPLPRTSPLLTTGARPTTLTFQQRADAAVSRVWRLYGLRDYLGAVLFDGTPPHALSLAANSLRQAAAGRPLFAKKAAAKLDLKGLRAAYHVPALTADNIDIRYLTALLDRARAQGVPVVVWVGPVDAGLLDTYGIWDRAGYARDMAFVRKLAEEHGASFVDMTFSVPAADIADSHHPLGVGYAYMARILAGEIDPQVRRLERARPLSGEESAPAEGGK